LRQNGHGLGWNMTWLVCSTHMKTVGLEDLVLISVNT
jgi:hypothetical protein